MSLVVLIKENVCETERDCLCIVTLSTYQRRCGLLQSVALLQLPQFLLANPAIGEGFDGHNELLEELPDSFPSTHPGSNVSIFDFGGEEVKVGPPLPNHPSGCARSLRCQPPANIYNCLRCWEANGHLPYMGLEGSAGMQSTVPRDTRLLCMAIPGSFREAHLFLSLCRIMMHGSNQK